MCTGILHDTVQSKMQNLLLIWGAMRVVKTVRNTPSIYSMTCPRFGEGLEAGAMSLLCVLPTGMRTDQSAVAT